MEWLFSLGLAVVLWLVPSLIVHSGLSGRIREQQKQLELLKAELLALRRQMQTLQNRTVDQAPPVTPAEDLLREPDLPPVLSAQEPFRPEPSEPPTDPLQEGVPIPPSSPAPPFPGRPGPVRSATTMLDREVDPFGGLLRFFTGERALVRLGIILVLIGMGFLLKLTVSEDLSVPVKLLIAASCAGALFGWGWSVRHTRKVFSVALQGGAFGILYFMVYASSALYGALPFAGGLLVWLLVGVAGGVLAVSQNAQMLAVLSVVGGFMAPIVMRTPALPLDPSNMLLIFTYYTLLNGGIVALSFLKPWRSLNVMGYLFSFLLASLWGILLYTPAYYGVAQPFLVLFFVMYTLTPLVHGLRRKAGRSDHILLLSVPTLTLLQQAGLVGWDRENVALATLGIGAVQYGLHLFTRTRATSDALPGTYLILAIGFVSLAVPLLTRAEVTSAVWAMEGVLLVVFGVRSTNRIHRTWGLVLLYLAALAVVWAGLVGFGLRGSIELLPGLTWVSVALLGTGLYLQKQRQTGLARGLLVTGSLIWIWAAVDGAVQWGGFNGASLLLALSVALLVLHLLALRFQAGLLDRFAGLLPVVAVLLTLWELLLGPPPMEAQALFAWLTYFVVQHFMLVTASMAPALQGSLYVLVTGLLFVRLMVLALQLLAPVGLATYAWVLVPLAFYWVHVLFWKRLPYTRKFPETQRDLVMLPLQLLQAGVFLTLLWRPPQLPYLPLLNLLEIAQLALFLTLFFPRVPWTSSDQTRRIRRNLLILLGLLGVSGMILRFMHAQFQVPWDFYALLDHNNSQTVLSIFWSVTALLFTLHAHRKGDRDLWAIGAGVLAFVVVKLFVLDLSNSDTWARVISFLGVGLLLLFMGFVAPVPPRLQKEEP